MTVLAVEIPWGLILAFKALVILLIVPLGALVLGGLLVRWWVIRPVEVLTDALGDKAKTQIVQHLTYEVTDPTIDSHLAQALQPHTLVPTPTSMSLICPHIYLYA